MQRDIEARELVDIESALSNLLGIKLKDLKQVYGGRNSKVYHLVCENSEDYIAKVYFHHGLDKRDRLGIEFSSLQFLWNNGVRCIPKPVAMDADKKIGIYEYIHGREILPEEVTHSDIDYLTNFLTVLKELRIGSRSDGIPAASAACFSISSICKIVEDRLNRLLNMQRTDEGYKKLHDFLNGEFIPLFNNAVERSKIDLKNNDWSFDSEISKEERTLSPSDFGFHNAIRKDNGEIIFIDFEYFGWDDPAKMISDFLLHPGMNLNDELKKRFLANILITFKEQKYLINRLKIAYPLIGLVWCLLLLNEFIPEHINRREFAGKDISTKEELLAEQLLKAEKLLRKINKDYESPLQFLL